MQTCLDAGCRNSSLGFLNPKGRLDDYFSSRSHGKQLCHTGKESCHEQIQVSVRSVTFPHSHHMLRMSRSENPQNPARPLGPYTPNFCLQGLTIRSCERHIKAMGTVAVWGRHNSSYGVGEPPSQTPAHTLPRVPEITSPTPRLTGSLRVSLPASACGKETFCEKSGRRLGPMILKEPHTHEAQGRFQNCD